jgi:hypothetical protein
VYYINKATSENSLSIPSEVEIDKLACYFWLCRLENLSTHRNVLKSADDEKKEKKKSADDGSLWMENWKYLG